jgi:arylsulfatase A-like enzyme
MKCVFLSLSFFLLVQCSESIGTPIIENKPNIIIILADDLGYGDIGVYGCTDIPTPNIDALARNGVMCTSGYVSCSQCAPSRAGLLSGRYQNEFGREANEEIDAQGIPSGINLFGDYMKKAGYLTGMVGKWHLGEMEGSHPLERGFDYFFGFLGGGSFYFPPGNEESINKIYEGTQRAIVTNYLTDAFGDKAVSFINTAADRPFFLYLSFNAPHTPLQAPQEYIDKFGHIADPERKIYAGMVSSMDDNIAKVMDALKEKGIEENTLVFFLSDNGGPKPVGKAKNGSSNTPLRGYKGDILEGGVRVPFIAQWEGGIPAGTIIDSPVFSLDLIPTAMAFAGISPDPASGLDGKNILPILRGDEESEREMTWRFPLRIGYDNWGIRKDGWKLVSETLLDASGRANGYKVGLYNLNDDIAESNDLSEEVPEKKQELLDIYENWNRTLPSNRLKSGRRISKHR